MDLFEQKTTELRVFGFTVIEQVLDVAVVATLRDFVVELEERIGVESSHRGTARHLANLVGLSPIFFDLIDHEKVLPYIEAIMGSDLILDSHQSHMQEPPEGFDTRYEVQAEIPAGSVIILNGQTWHGGGENKSLSKRAAVFGHYRYGQWMRFQCDPHDQFSPAWLEQLSHRQKRLLRMTQGVTGKHGADFYER